MLPEDPAVSLAKFVVEVRFENLDPAVVQMAKHSILDTLAVSIAGSSQSGVRESIEVMRGLGGEPDATVWLFGNRLPVDRAAFANGPMARALDMGDVHEEGGHVGEYILPSLLAAAELKKKRGALVSGKEFLTAYVAGAEALSRIGLACRAITSGTTERKNPQMGTFGAAIAVAKILEFDLPKTQNALGIAYSAMGSFDSQMYYDGTLMQRVHHGFVCADAIIATLLAERGVTGPTNIFTGQGSLFQLFYPQFRDIRRITEGLGVFWEFAAGNMIKPYMCCKCFHSSMYALDLLIGENAINPEDIDEIRAVVTPMAYFTDANYSPKTMVDRQMSAPWSLAHVALHGELFLHSYEGEDSHEICGMMQKIKFDFDQAQSMWSGKVSVRANGRSYERQADYCIGHPRNPIDWHWLRRKMAACCRHSAVPFSGERQARLLAAVQSIENLQDCSELIDLMTPT